MTIKTIHDLEERIRRHDWRYHMAEGRAWHDGHMDWQQIHDALQTMNEEDVIAAWLRAAPESEHGFIHQFFEDRRTRAKREAEREAKRVAARAERDAMAPGAFVARTGPVSAQQRKADRLAREAYYAAMRAREEEANERSKAEWAARIASREAER